MKLSLFKFTLIIPLFFGFGYWYVVTESDNELTKNQKIAVEYFKEVALGFELGSSSKVTRKWGHDILIYVTGEPNNLLLRELDTIITDLNRLIPDTGPELRLTNTSANSNFLIFLGPGSDYAEMDSRAKNNVASNYGLFFVKFNSRNVITSATMYVDTERAAEINQRHLLREELTQALGLARDSGRFSDSIFQERYSGTATSYNQFDEAVIRMLYHPEMRTGLDAESVDPVLRQVVKDVIE
jgi:hypothetical protein